MEYIKELSRLRKKKKISQKSLASLMGISSSALCQLEKGMYSPTLDQVERYAKALGSCVKLHIDEIESLIDENTDTYVLKLYDTALLYFRMIKPLDESLKIELISVNREKVPLLPLDLELSPEGIESWLKHRSIPKNRAYVNEILHALDIPAGDLKGIVDVCFSLSLNDCYWVVPVSFTGLYADYNLYQNHFDAALSLVAYTGYGSVQRNFTTSPELTTNGMLPKCWKMEEDGSINLYKQGTSRFSNTGREPYCEHLAWQIGMAMGLNMVEYQTVHYKGAVSSVCPVFTDLNTSYMPVGRLVQSGGLEAVVQFYKDLGEEFYQSLASMLIFDVLICNEDRHFGNFGLLIDSRTNQIIKPAPLFDHGMSLLQFIPKDQLKNFQSVCQYADTRGNPYGIDPWALAEKYIGDIQKKQLKRLIGFQFDRSAELMLPEKHLRYLERLIRKRVEKLLKL